MSTKALGQSPLRGETSLLINTVTVIQRLIPVCTGKNREFEKFHHLWLIPAFAGNGDGVTARAVIMLTVPHFLCQVYGAVRVNPNLRGKTHCIYLQIRRQPGQSPPCGENDYNLRLPHVCARPIPTPVGKTDHGLP